MATWMNTPRPIKTLDCLLRAAAGRSREAQLREGTIQAAAGWLEGQEVGSDTLDGRPCAQAIEMERSRKHPNRRKHDANDCAANR